MFVDRKFFTPIPKLNMILSTGYNYLQIGFSEIFIILCFVVYLEVGLVRKKIHFLREKDAGNAT